MVFRNGAWPRMASRCDKNPPKWCQHGARKGPRCAKRSQNESWLQDLIKQLVRGPPPYFSTPPRANLKHQDTTKILQDCANMAPGRLQDATKISKNCANMAPGRLQDATKIFQNYANMAKINKNCANMAPGRLEDATKIDQDGEDAPGRLQDATKIDKNCANMAPGRLQDAAKIDQNGTKIEPGEVQKLNKKLLFLIPKHCFA